MTPIPVKERLPEDNQRVLVYENEAYGWMFAIHRNPDLYKGQWFMELTPEWFDPNVTHWLPLPPRPE